MIIVETAIPLGDVPNHLPKKSHSGKKVSKATVYRWTYHGVRGGIKLETCFFGGQRYTSKEALDRFFAAITAAADGEMLPSRTPRQREQAIRQAELELEREGI
jgi:hypothetical protein